MVNSIIFQNEKNQIMKSNVWLRLVSIAYYLMVLWYYPLRRLFQRILRDTIR